MLNLQDLDLDKILFSVGISTVRVIIVLIAALIAVRVTKKLTIGLTNRLLGSATEQSDVSAAEHQKRMSTLTGLVTTTSAVAIWVIAAVMALREAGFDIGPLLAGAGVVGLAVGFGAQNLVRDVITGVFVLVEDQIRVGDVAVINDRAGAVQAINLRTTVLRDLEGVVHVFPNGNIESISNKTKEYSNYVFDIGVAYKEDTDRVSEVLREIGEQIRQDPEWGPMILDPLEILGVDRFDDSAVVIKMRIKTAPGKQFPVGRQMNRRIKKKFDELKIEIPFPHQTLYFGEVSKPFKLDLGEATQDIVRNIVRQELAQKPAEG